jgi:hypothetical protein
MRGFSRRSGGMMGWAAFEADDFHLTKNASASDKNRS